MTLRSSAVARGPFQFSPENLKLLRLDQRKKLKAGPEPAVLVQTDGTTVDIVAAVETADVGIKGGGERIVVVVHGLNGFVQTYYTTAAKYPFIIGKLFFIKVCAPACKDFSLPC